MRRWRGLGLVLLAGAAASLGWGALQGELEVALFLVFPVVYGSGIWGLLGIGLLMGAFGAFFLDAAAGLPGAPPGGRGRRGTGFGDEPGAGEPSRPGEARPREDPWAGAGDQEEGGWLRGGGVVMLGPIPIVLGSDKRSTMVLMGLAVLLMALGLAWWVLVRG